MLFLVIMQFCVCNLIRIL